MLISRIAANEDYLIQLPELLITYSQHFPESSPFCIDFKGVLLPVRSNNCLELFFALHIPEIFNQIEDHQLSTIGALKPASFIYGRC
nr:hypothetical protein CFP56_16335 [Quercus suber]